jgi:hypothetical protein
MLFTQAAEEKCWLPMTRSRTEYHFKLPRKKRIGGVLSRMPFGLIAVGFFGIFTFLFFSGDWWAVLPACISLFLARNFLYALTRFAVKEYENMCIVIDENGVGFGEHKPDWCIFADGITDLELESDGYWMLHHVNGTFLYFPADVISKDDISYLRGRGVFSSQDFLFNVPG